MRLSHSKLSQILSCPMTYYLRYEAGMWQKVEKPALAIGSAVHWGIEHNTADLSDFYKANGTFKQGDNYTREQMLAEAMVQAYLDKKEQLFAEMLTDPKTGEPMQLLDESHELYLNAKFDGADHKFVGIIDLLLLTNKGFVLVDYKTSSLEPDWDGYLDQLYRYIFELRSNFPDMPIVKIAIVNIRKTGIRQKKSETPFEFEQRMVEEYRNPNNRLVVYHEFLPSDIEEQHIQDYIENLRTMCDLAQNVVDNKLFFINYGAAKNQYGKSEFYDIFYRTPGAEALYAISDRVWNEDEQKFDDRRDCIKLDMQIIEHAKDERLMNKYAKYKACRTENDKIAFERFYTALCEHFVCNKKLCNLYELTYQKEKEVNMNARE